jgi:hypothetical protein
MRPATTTLLTTAAAIAILSGCTDRQTVTAPRQAAVTAHADRHIGGAFTSFDPPGSALTLVRPARLSAHPRDRHQRAGPDRRAISERREDARVPAGRGRHDHHDRLSRRWLYGRGIDQR